MNKRRLSIRCEIGKTRLPDCKPGTESVLSGILEFPGEPPCADCLLPFGDRINASQAEAKRGQMAVKVKSLRSFRDSEDLYRDAMSIRRAGLYRQTWQANAMLFPGTFLGKNKNSNGGDRIITMIFPTKELRETAPGR